MQRFLYKQKGAISIFLAIVLIPIMMISSIFIDVSRIQLANSLISSAGDLTLNTTLTNYDNVLKDMYGLFAISQTEDELMNNLEDYYRKSMKSAGLTAEDANTYVGKIMKQLGVIADSKDTSDLLKIELEDNQDIIKTSETTSLANPTLLKKQIVEFMKYRFGIGVGMSFISSLKCFDTLSEQMDVIEKRTEYYEEQKTVIENCEKAWKKIVEYNNLNTNIKYFEKLKTDLEKAKNNYKYITENYTKDFYNSKNRNGNNKNYFSEENTIIIKKVSDSPKEFKLIDKGSEYTDFGTYTDTKPATSEQLNGFIYDLNKNSDLFKKLKNSTQYKNILAGNGVGIYEVQRVIQFNRLADTETENLSDAVKQYYIAFNKLVVGLESIDNSIKYYKGKIEEIQGEITELEGKIETCQGTINVNDIAISAGNINLNKLNFSLIGKSGDEYNQILNDIVKQQDAINNSKNDNINLNIDIKKYQNDIESKKVTKKEYEDTKKNLEDILDAKVTYYNTTKTYKSIRDLRKPGYETDCELYAFVVQRMIDTINLENVSKKFINDTALAISNKQWVEGNESNNEIKRISEVLDKYHTTLKDASSYLDIAGQYLNTVIKSLETGGELYKKRETWGSTSGKKKIEGTVISEQNLEEIESVKEFMKAEEVKDLKTRIDGTKSTIDTILKELESYHYAGKELYNIKDIDGLIKTIDDCATKFDFVKVPLKENDLNTFIDKVYTGYMKYPNNIMSTPWVGENADWIHSVSPVLNTAGGECNFYKYLRKNFPDVEVNGAETVNDTKIEDTKIGTVEKEMEEAKEDAEKKEITGGSAAGKDIKTDDNSPSNYWDQLKKEIEKINSESVKNNSDSIGKLTDPKSDGFVSSLSNLFSKIGEMITNFSVDFRDNIYISDYILSMFSYDTYEKEIMYNILKEKDETSSQSLSYVISHAFSGTIYDNNNINPSYTYAEEYGNQARTLTNVPISPFNNSAYLKEAEYILYGSSGVEGTYATIYGIRFAFNTIYAFTDSEIREGAYSIALAVFGTPPLTFLVPIAQAAIIIAVSLAESGIDLAMLKAGMEVPLFKTSETWILKFSSLLSSLTEEAVDFLSDQAKNLVSNGIQELNKWLDMTDKEIDELIKNGKESMDEINKNVTNGIEESLKRYTDAAVNQLINICQVAETLTDNEGKIDGVLAETYVMDKMKEWLSGESTGINQEALANDIGHIAKQEAVNYILTFKNESGQSYVRVILDQIKNAAGDTANDVVALSQKLHDNIEEISTKVFEHTNTASEKIKSYKDKAVANIKSALEKGGKEFKEALSETIDGVAGNVKDSLGGSGDTLSLNKDNNSAATFFSFSYSDYLRLFLVIGLTFNQEAILLRTADVIETNMRLKTESFNMKQAYTYAELKAVLKVKPLMMTLPFMSAITDSHLSGDGWYTINYRGVLGY